MLETDRWLLPEGIEELLPPEAARLEHLRRRLLDLFDTWGYDLVIPPLVEYLESLLTGTGNDLDLQTFKLIDQVTGRLVGVRADMTPQAARIDTHRLRREGPSRLCYLGTVLHTRPDGFAGSRSPFQVGAELYGYPGIEADVEIVRLMVETLSATGLEGLHLDLGHVGIFRGLARTAGLAAVQEASLFEALQRKARPEIDQFLADLDIAEAPRRMLGELAALNGGEEAMARARQVLADAEAPVIAALDNLGRIAEAVKRSLPGLPVHFDLGEVRGYNYHTGAVFSVFVPGHGQAVAQGGRYDDIGKVFGRARAATGFSTDLRTLMALVPAIEPEVRGIFAPWQEDPALETRIAELRAQGERVVRELPEQAGGAAEMGCDRALVRQAGTWSVEPLKKA
jgi:ATP phosphoribosyltransferase regulatory subunit